MNYYNEFDPKAAAWLRELINQGLIPRGDVDTRSITDVLPTDLLGYTQCHFFAGIGGWSLALQLAGWPKDRPVWTGSCPCQPFSNAGKQLGEKDPRHLWPVFRELIRQCRPATVFGEQVASKAGRAWLSGVFVDLEGMVYAVAGADLCAASVGAPQIGQRLFWVATPNRPRRPRKGSPQPTKRRGDTVPAWGVATSRGTDGRTRRIGPGPHGMAYGVSARVAINSGFSNAIVPQVAAEFIKACMWARAPFTGSEKP